MNRLALAALMTGAAANASCASTACTLVPCPSANLTITMQSLNGAWLAGTYTLSLGKNGALGHCTLMVPASPLGTEQGDCSTAVSLSLQPVSSDPSVVCDGGACHGRSATSAPQHFSLHVVLYQGMPAQVSLNLSRDANPVLSTTVAPKYETVEPNGPGCGTCTTGAATLSVPSA